MDLIHAVWLALIQGLTEFLPISSSAHLILAPELLGWQDQGLAFDVGVHVGTLLAVMLYFRQQIFDLIRGWIQQTFFNQPNPEAKLAWWVAIGTIPAGLLGYFLDDLIELYLRSALIIGIATIGFGLLLAWADRKQNPNFQLDQMNLKQCIVIGLSQALALIPGTSRSGITITAALGLGFSRQAAARFSFLLSIPLILAAGSLKGYQLVSLGEKVNWEFIFTGLVVAAVSAYTCIHLFLKLLDKIGMMPFVIYRLILGAGLVLYSIV